MSIGTSTVPSLRRPLWAIRDCPRLYLRQFDAVEWAARQIRQSPAARAAMRSQLLARDWPGARILQARPRELLPLHERRPRRPQDSALHALVRENLESFVEHARLSYAKPLPRYVVDELHACRVLKSHPP